MTQWNNEGFTQWTPFAETTKYFAPSTKDFIINYRAENIEGNKLELGEPYDVEYEKLGIKLGAKTTK